MHSFAKDQHVTRRSACMPALMFETECDILFATSMQFEAIPLGWSTLMMSQMFCPTFLKEKLSNDMFDRLQSYVATGEPRVRSANDGCGTLGDVAANDVLENTNSRRRAERFVSQILLTELDGDESEECEASDADTASTEPVSASSSCEELRWTRTPTPTTNGDINFAKKNNLIRASTIVPVLKRRINPRVNWSDEEDRQLVRAYKRHGGKWRKISRELKMGSDDRLRNRWERLRSGTSNCPPDVTRDVASLDPNPGVPGVPGVPADCCGDVRKSRRGSKSQTSVERKKWTSSEDDAIIEFVSKCRPNEQICWILLSKIIHGRTKHAIRNRASRLSELGRLGQIKQT